MMAPVNSMALANTTQRTQAVFSSLSFTFTGGAARRKTVNSKYTGTITGGGGTGGMGEPCFVDSVWLSSVAMLQAYSEKYRYKI